MFSQRNTQASSTRSAVSYDAGLRAHMGSVYNRMSLGVLVTAITAWFVSSSPALLQLFLGGPQAYIIMFAPIAVIWFGFNPRTMDSGKLRMAFLAIAVLYGISFSTIALAFSGESIARAFFVTVAMFAGLSIFGYTTKKDLTMLGTFSVMAMIGLFLISIIGLFVGFSSQMHFFINLGVVLAFSGITAWETQSTKEMYSASNGAEGNSRLAWSSALSLYISFVAIFINMLQLMNQR